MNYELIIWLSGLMLFAFWLNYVLGSPLAEISKVDPGAILSGIPRWLADRRLRQANLKKGIDEQLTDELAVTRDLKIQVGLYKDWKRNRLDVGREFFTWERFLLCPICLHFWLTVIFGAVVLSLDLLHARQDWLLAGFTYLLNHFFIRKIS